ncbi:lbp bpi cetp family protein [Stylonychia lemnae]|uniref:Lbp bpi cetp family protein n=1 Tax=Stylonychia lemnae TaxID=5949 RepID=A0A078B2M4_STYLE|nr:lbp bpi cetp family protein [Stylonychia lemnae]|eukprot:CDW88790.1 lbp bpi cetp family protein [Stylonychia lemnae]
MRNYNKLFTLACLLATTLFSATQANLHPGITGSIDLSLFEDAKDAYLANIIDSLNGLSQFDYDLPRKQGFIKNNTIHITETPSDVKLSTSDNNVFNIEIRDLTVNFVSQFFRYNLWFIPVKGFAKIKMSKVNLLLSVQLTTKTEKSRTLLQFNVVKADLQLDYKRLDFDLGGGFLADFIDIFIPLFRKTISGDIERSVEAQLKSDLPQRLNQDLITDNGFLEPWKFPAFQNMTIDYSVEVNPSINGTYLGAGFNGTVFNKGMLHYKPVSDPIMMPFHNYKVKSRVQFFISEYFLETAAHSALQDMAVGFFISHKIVPESLPFDLTTTGLERYFNGMEATFGKDVPVDLNFTLADVRDFEIVRSKEKIIASVDFAIDFIVAFEDGRAPISAGKIEFNSTVVDFSVDVKGKRVTMEINDIDIEKIFIESDYLGNLDVSILKVFLNFALNEAIPFFNFLFGDYYVDLPEVIFGFFGIKDISFTYYDHYLECGISPKFLPLTSQKKLFDSFQKFNYLFEEKAFLQ